MRYLKHVVTNAISYVGDDDDQTFEALKAQRLENGRPAYVQTGSHDPAVDLTLAGGSKFVFANAASVAAGNDLTTIIGEAPYSGTVTSVVYVPPAGITGADTNTRTISVINKGQDGAGNTVIATLALANGVNATAFDEKALTVSGTAANKKVVKGDVLAFTSTHAASGLADPGGQVRVAIQPTQE